MEELIPTQSRSIKSSTWELLAYYHDFVFFSWVKKSLPCYYGNNPEKKKKKVVRNPSESDKTDAIILFANRKS